MPFDSVVVTLAVVAMFAVFAGALAWASARAGTAHAESQRRTRGPAE